MKKIYAGLLCASLLAFGTGATAIPTTIKADSNYGYTNIGTSVVTMIDTGGQIYDANGQATGKFLPMGSEWKTTLENTLASGSYYGIGNNEFVKASDVDLSVYDGLSTGATGEPVETNYSGVAVTKSDGAAVYSQSGTPIGKTLPYGTNWKIGPQINLTSGTYYQVGIGEYLRAADVRPYQGTIEKSISQVITTRSGAPKLLYNSNGQLISGRALAPGTSWYSDRYCNIGMVGYYRVATDEYVNVTDVY